MTEQSQATIEAQLAEQGVADVERRLAQGVYGKHNEAAVKAWLWAQRGERPSAPWQDAALRHLVRWLPIPARARPAKIIAWAVAVIVIIELLSMFLVPLFM